MSFGEVYVVSLPILEASIRDSNIVKLTLGGNISLCLVSVLYQHIVQLTGPISH